MNSWDTAQVKMKIFDIFDHARELYNVYYRTGENYTKEDLQIIKKYIELIENKTKEIKEDLGYVI